LRIQLYNYSAFGFTNNIGFATAQINTKSLATALAVRNPSETSPDVNWK
jgi:hypothetical protein